MLPMLGDMSDRLGDTEARLGAPCAALYAPGASHANRIGRAGLESVSLEFDPAWFGQIDPRLRAILSHGWAGHLPAGAARRLIHVWRNKGLNEASIANATVLFMLQAANRQVVRRPSWLADVETVLERFQPPSTRKIAEHLNLNSAWLARAYRAVVGEGLGETLRRKRVERAAVLLRATEIPPAEVASVAGFCDQSHMIRCFKVVLGRTPAQVRADAALLRE